jgi:hypothetical protein
VDKGLDSAVSFAQSLSQWAYITIGASLALLFKDLSQRPKHWLIRYSFLVFFLPGWFFLGLVIFKGMRVHGAYIAYLMGKHDVQSAVQNINADAAAQLSALRCGLFVFGVWLVVYLFWWVTHRDESK